MNLYRDQWDMLNEQSIIISSSTLTFGLAGFILSYIIVGGDAEGMKMNDRVFYKGGVITLMEDEIVRLSHDAEIIWSQSVEFEKRGLYSLEQRQDEIILVYRGETLSASGTLKSRGTSSFRFYNIESGSLQSTLKIPLPKKEYVLDYHYGNDTLKILSQSAIKTYTVHDGKLISALSEVNRKYPSINLVEFIDQDDLLYLKNKFIPYHEFSKRGLFIRNRAGSIIELNSKFELIAIHDEEIHFKIVDRWENFSLISNGTKISLMLENGDVVRTSLSHQAYLDEEGFLIDAENGQTIVVNLRKPVD